MATALSIDLDYFNDDPNYENLQKIMERVLKLDVPMLFVESHENMITFLSRFEFDTLINMDQHLDMVKRGVKEEHCGSWVNFIATKRQKRNYVWLLPSMKYASEKGWDKDNRSCKDDRYGQGRTDHIKGFLTEEKKNLRSWHKVKVTTAQSIIRWQDVVCVGFALSQGFTNGDVIQDFEDNWFDKLLIKGIKIGRDVPGKDQIADRRKALHDTLDNRL